MKQRQQLLLVINIVVGGGGRRSTETYEFLGSIPVEFFYEQERNYKEEIAEEVL